MPWKPYLRSLFRAAISGEMGYVEICFGMLLWNEVSKKAMFVALGSCFVTAWTRLSAGPLCLVEVSGQLLMNGVGKGGLRSERLLTMEQDQTILQYVQMYHHQ
jgi:hypothetical protein